MNKIPIHSFFSSASNFYPHSQAGSINENTDHTTQTHQQSYVNSTNYFSLLKMFSLKFPAVNEQVTITLQLQRFVLNMQQIPHHLISFIKQIIKSNEIYPVENHVLVH